MNPIQRALQQADEIIAFDRELDAVQQDVVHACHVDEVDRDGRDAYAAVCRCGWVSRPYFTDTYSDQSYPADVAYDKACERANVHEDTPHTIVG